MVIAIIAGMLIQLTGLSTILAKKPEKATSQLIAAAEKDSLVRIDIRTADKDELILLPGIGEKRAVDIIAYRQSKQFESAEELLNIRGIGVKTFQNMKSMLLSFGNFGEGVANKNKLSALANPEVFSQSSSRQTSQQALDVSPALTKMERRDTFSTGKDVQQTVYLNTATKEELISLTGIGEVKAEAILRYRMQIGKFSSVDQLLDVKGIGPKTLEKNRSRIKL